MAAPTIESVNPANLQTGVVLGSPIWVIFDKEIDPASVARAFLVEANDSDRWTGPDLILYDRPLTPTPDFYLDTPGYKGILEGTFTYEKLTALGVSTSSPTYDPDASAFKTKLTFTPTKIMAPGVQFRVYVAGDENSSDTVRIGIASRTVGDTELGTNLGSGGASFTGGYIGTAEDQYVVEVTLAGEFGTAKFSWWRTSNPLNIRTGTVSQNEVILNEGVYLSFSGSDFRVGDRFTTRVDPPEYMTTTSSWVFTTGSGDITTVPSSTSTSVIGDVGTPVAPTIFEVSTSNPVNLATSISRSKRTITITFTNNLGTITPDQVAIDILPALGLYTGVTGQSDIPKILSVSGRVLTIQI